MASPKLEPVVLTDEERQVLEGWARRRKTAQALALRSRIVLACADGGPSARSRPSWGDAGPRWASGGRGSWSSGWRGWATSRARAGRARSPTTRSRGDRRTLERAAERRHALVDAVDGQAAGMSQTAVRRIWRAFGLKPHLVQTLQAVHGPAVHRQGPRHRRPVPGPAGAGGGAVRGREVADPGAGPHRARAADDARDPGADAPTTTSATAPPACSPRWTWPAAR